MTPYNKYLPILLSLSTTTALINTPPTILHQKHQRCIAKLQQPRPSSFWSRATAADSSNTVLYQARDNDRARMEKSWENMMGEGKLFWLLDVMGRFGYCVCIF